MKKRWLAALLSLCMTMTMVPVGAMAADIENDIAESPVNLTEIVPQDPSALDEQPASPETTLLEESEPAEDEPKAEMVAEVEGKQYETLEAAIEAARNGDTVTLLKDIALVPNETGEDATNPLIIIKQSIILNLNHKTIGWDEDEHTKTFVCTPVIFSIENAEVTITGNGTIDSELGYNNSYGINIVKDGKLVVENGTFTGATTAVQVTTGELTILDGFFKQAKTIASAAPGYAKYVVNAIDKNWEEGTARIYIKGGRFCFDPANKPENTESTYVAEGYVTTSEDNDGSTFYTVEAATAKTDSKYYATLAEAVQAVVSSKSKTGTVTLLKDAAGGGIGLFKEKDAINVNLTIDFGGFTYTCKDPAVGSVGTESQGFHLEKVI